MQIPDFASNLVVIDPRVEDYPVLAAGVIPGATVLILEPDTDGIEQIARSVSAADTAIGSIHIISHGSPGCLYLGNSQLSLETLERYADNLQAWQVPALLLYGCNVAAGDAGAEFIAKLHQLTGAEIAASTTPIGSDRLGGNWALDCATSILDTQIAILPEAQTAYQGVLAVNTDGDSVVEDIDDLDDDNDGILDADEGLTITFDVVTSIPAGAIPGNPQGLRLSDATGQFVVDLFEGPTTSAGAPFSFNTTTGEISNTMSNLGGNEVVEIIYTTANSPTPLSLETIQILDIDSLSASTVRDAFLFNQPGTFTPLGTGGPDSPAGAVISLDPAAPSGNDIGSVVIVDPDAPDIDTPEEFTFIPEFNQVFNNFTGPFSDVLVNVDGEFDNHNVEFAFDDPQTTVSLIITNAGINGAAWSFFPQFTTVLQDFVGIDTDGDGISDHLDLDSDNDGISDLIESGQDPAVVDIDNNGVVDGTVDIDGVPEGANGGVTPVDSDSDLIPDFLDLDSDGDTIPDTIELRASVDFVANDGDVSDDDTEDSDGVIDEFDGVVGHGGAFEVPVNTDAGIDDIPDFLDLDSDGDGIPDSTEAGPIATPPDFTDPDGSVNDPLGDADGLLNVDLNPNDVDFRSLDVDVIAPSAPTVNIDEDLDDNGLIGSGELDGDVDVTVTLPDDAMEGDTLTVTDGIAPQTFVLDAADIAAGTVTATFAAPDDGMAIDVTASLTDAAGNAGPDGTDSATVDITAPTAPTVNIDEDLDDNGLIGSGELDGDVDVTVTLPDDAMEGDTLTVTDGIAPQTFVLDAADIAAGTVTATFTAPDDGMAIDVTANLTDAAGNASPDSTDSATVDITTPTAPMVAIAEDLDNDGLISGDELEGDVDVTVTLPDDAMEGDTLLVTDGMAPQTFVLDADDIAAGSVTASFAPPAEGADIEVTANITDAAGNSSDDGTDTATLDTVAGAPTVTIEEDSNDDGAIGDAELEGDVDVTVTLPDDAMEGDTLLVTDGMAPQTFVLDADDIAAGSVTASFAPPAEGTDIEVTANITDAAGNSSDDGTDAATLDTVAGTPTVTIAEDLDNDGLISGDELEGDVDVTVTLPDDAMEGDTLLVTDGMAPQTFVLDADDITAGSVTASFAPPAEGADIEVTANITDAAGNSSDDGTDAATLDTVAGAPTITIDEDLNDDGVISDAELEGDIDVTVTLPDDAVAGDTLVVDDGVMPQTVVLSADNIAAGSVTATFPAPAQGTVLTVTANVTDAAGNVSPDGSDSATVDAVADSPSVVINEDANNDGFISNAELDGDVDVTIGLPIDAMVGDTLLVTDGVTPQTFVLDAADIAAENVAVTFAPPAEGTDLTITANITDAVGNTSSDGTDAATVDAVAGAPTVAIAEDANNDGFISDVELEGDVDVIVELPADATAGDTLVVDDGIMPQTVVLSVDDIAAGSVMVAFPAPAEGMGLTVSANITDAAGNVSPEDSDTATVDTIAGTPTVTIAEDANNDGLISGDELEGDVDVTVTLPDDAMEGDTLTVTDGIAPQTFVLDAADIAAGSVAATFSAPAEGTELTVSANLTDAAGNVSPDSTDSATLDTVANAPTIAITEDANNDGIISADELEGEVDVTVGLPADAVAGDTLVVTDGITPQTIVLDADDIAAGNVAVTFAVPADGADLNISANITDAAGNVSPDATDAATADISAPGAPTVTIDEDLNDDGAIGDAELDGDVDVTVGLPIDAMAGDTLVATDGITPQTIVLDADDIAAGNVAVTFAAPAEGAELAISANLTDVAGNVSPDGSDSATLDTVAGAPIVTIDEDANDDGFIGGDEFAGAVNVTVTLPDDAVEGDTLTVTDGITPQTLVLSASDIADGNVTAIFAAPAEGAELTVSASLTDAAGNTSPDGSDSAILDTVVSAPTVTIAEDANDNGVIDAGELEGDIDVAVGLPADAVVGDALVVTDGITPQTIVLDADDIAAGTVAATFAAPASGTELTISANLTDAVGNISSASSDAATVEASAPPVITSEPAIAVEADQAILTTIVADDADPDEELTFSIVGGDDAALFSLDPVTGELSFLNPPDLANPIDTDGDNIFELQVAVTDAAGNTDIQTLSVMVGDGAVPNPPDIDVATFVVPENTTVVTVLNATDPDVADGDILSFSVTGGDDATAFSIDPATGELSFIAPPDFENPSDIDGDNVFDLEITVTDSTGLTDLLDATVTVTDIPEDDVDDSDPGQPNAVDDLVDAIAGQPAIAIDVLANDTDPDGDPLTITAVTQPAQGTAEIDDNGTPDDPSDDFIVFTPAAGAGADDLSLAQSEAEAGILQLGGDFAAFTDSFTVTVADPDGNTASSTVEATVEAQAMLEFALLGSDALCHNEVGVYVTDDAAGTINGIAPGEAGYAEAALSSGQVIFSAMPGVTELFGEAPNRILDGFSASDNLGFFLIQNDTVDSVLLDIESGNESAEVFFAPVAANSDGAEHASVSALESGNGFTVAFEDQLGGGDGDFNDLIFSVELTDEAPLLGTEFQGGREGELLSLLGSGPVTAEFVAESDAAFDNTVGFYVIDDISGAIAGADGALLAPDDAGYAEAAIANAVTVFGEEGTTVDLAGDELLAPFLIADGTVADFQTGSADAFFAFLGANPDGIDHIRLLGDNTFGFEDMLGGGDGDFNDFVLQANFA